MVFEDEIPSDEDEFDTISQSTDTTNTESKAESTTELLDFTFRFINEAKQDEELNALLCGYFSKLLLQLLNYNKAKLHSYLFATKDLMSNLCMHLYNKSISDFVLKVLAIPGIELTQKEE